MKQLRITSRILLLTLFSINVGCEQVTGPNETATRTNSDNNKLSLYTPYAPFKIDVMPLTEFVSPGNTQQSKINVYVSLLDPFGSQIKSPGMFRFELYEYMQRSSEPKGKRAGIWPDVDLTDPVTNNDYWLDLTDPITNNNYWQDFLRAYKFSFPCEQTGSQDYILQVTCLCPNGKRLSSEFTLRQSK